MGLRVHRSISWIGRAEAAEDDDVRVIFLWIAFNAAYADEREFQGPAPGERAAFAAQDTARTLSFVFDRLYVLRNQLVHGGATWDNRVNRGQVRDGASILGFLVPVFVDVMMDNPHEDWGRPFYPVVE